MEFETLAPRCIVCDAPMKRIMYETTNLESRVVKAKYYSINMQCTRDERCFGYTSNAVSIYDLIVVKRFYIGFPKIQLFAEANEYTQVSANGSVMKLQYIPFETFIKAKGQVYEKIEKLLVLVDGVQ